MQYKSSSHVVSTFVCTAAGNSWSCLAMTTSDDVTKLRAYGNASALHPQQKPIFDHKRVSHTRSNLSNICSKMVDRYSYIAVLIAFCATINLGMAGNRLLCPAQVICAQNSVRCVPGGGEECGDWGICCGAPGPAGSRCCVTKPNYIPSGNEDISVVAAPNPAPAPEVSDGRNPDIDTVPLEETTPIDQSKPINGSITEQSTTDTQPPIAPVVLPELVPEESSGAAGRPAGVDQLRPSESDRPQKVGQPILTWQPTAAPSTTQSTTVPPILLPALEPAIGAGLPGVAGTPTTTTSANGTSTRPPIQYSGLSINKDDDDRR